MNKPLITVVIPIYNVEKYLNECVESIMKQKYDNIEILLIDDGSTDHSGKICDELCDKDSRIKVYHKSNGGLSDARNYGIEKASGKYICFVDSDDFVTCDYISSMYNNMKKFNTKIVACGISYSYDNGTKKEINYQNISKLYKKNSAQIFLNIIGYYNVSACNKLFDIKLFSEIRFPVGKKSEDWYIMYKLIEKSGSIYYNSDSKYIYRQRIGSITKASSANIDAIHAAHEVSEYFKTNKEVYPYTLQSEIFAIIGVFNFELLKGSNKEILSDYFKKIKQLYKKASMNFLPFPRKIQLILFIHFNFLYKIIFKMYNKRREFL